MPENPEIFQPLTLLQEVADRESDRLAAIRIALAHPQFYDGDIGADIRWLLSGYELLRQHAKSHQRDHASLAAKLDKADRQVNGLLSLVEMWQEVDRDEAPTAGRYRALTQRRDTWLARYRAQEGK